MLAGGRLWFSHTQPQRSAPALQDSSAEGHLDNGPWCLQRRRVATVRAPTAWIFRKPALLTRELPPPGAPGAHRHRRGTAYAVTPFASGSRDAASGAGRGLEHRGIALSTPARVGRTPPAVPAPIILPSRTQVGWQTHDVVDDDRQGRTGRSLVPRAITVG